MSKLAEIIRYRRLSPAQLNERTGISENRIETILAGADATMLELRKLAATLKVSLSDLSPDTEKERAAALLFRRAPISGNPVDYASIANLSRRMARSFDLLEGISGSGPHWLKYFKHGSNTYNEAQENATLFRRVFFNDNQYNPLLSLPKIAVERMQIMVFVVNSNGFDGASAYFEAIPFIFVSARYQARMLFTLAHEIGHLIAHHDPNVSYAIIDENMDRQSNAVEEQYANAFASALLMPSAGVATVLKKVREKAGTTDQPAIGDIEISYLARIYGVSFPAAARRCEDLGLIAHGGGASLNEYLKKNFGSAEKRADDAGLPPRPQIDFPPVPHPLLRSAVERIKAGELSVGRAATVLGVSIGDLLSANAHVAH